MRILFPFLILSVLIILISAYQPRVYSSTTPETAIAFIGDIGLDTNGKKTLEVLSKEGIPVVGLGDYAYSCDFRRFIDKAENIDFIGVLGNHDVLDCNESETKVIAEFMGLDQQKDYNFAKEIGAVLVLGINHYIDGDDASAAQFNFTENALKNSTQKFKVVVAHEPAITPKVKGGHEAKTDFLKTYEPLWKRFGVDAVITGHNHIYGWQNNDGEDIDYLICGQGGKGNDKLADKDPFDVASTNPFGFCKLIFNSDTGAIKLDIVSNKSVNSTGHGKVIETVNLR